MGRLKRLNVFPKPGYCCWPFGDPGEPGFWMCGSPAKYALPYCDVHAGAARVNGEGHFEVQNWIKVNG
jgi:hypothetical protein